MDFGILSALFLGMGGWVFATIQWVIKRKDDKLLSAMSYLDGGTQKRNIGIGIIESLLEKDPKIRNQVIPTLVNQVVYLLLESPDWNKRSEFHNFLRLMSIIINEKHFDKKFDYHYIELIEAISSRMHQDREEKFPGRDHFSGDGWYKKVAEFYYRKEITNDMIKEWRIMMGFDE